MKALIYILSLVCAGTMLAQPNWDFSITDKSHNILIPADIDGGSFEMGDYIGVFYDDNGELLCAGYSEYTEGNIALTAFGASFSYSGFTVGQAFHFIHWSSTDQIQNELFAVYNSIDFPNGEQFVVDGLSGISSFSIEYIPGCTDDQYFEYNPVALQDDGTCQTLWSEAYTISQTNLLETHEALIVSQNENIELSESLNSSLDSLDNIIYVLSQPILVNLQTGWNMIGFTCSEPKDAIESISQINDILIILKNNEGYVYLPEYEFNGIGDLIPGHGYQLKITEDYQNFTFPN
jgi:hypothetical protein